jgi:pimeloyl-ACP methyl ester carboxylesterase
MSQHWIDYKSSRINYYRFGEGVRPVICFHGYGEEARSFEFLAKYAGDDYCFYSLDLPFHGETEWKEGLNCTVGDLINIIQVMLRMDETDRGFDGVASRELALMGYSLGGRVALCMYESMNEKVNRIVLLAPDGLKVNFWYWIATQTMIGNKLFAFTMKNPAWFFSWLKLFRRLGMVNVSVFKFVNFYIGNPTIRRLLYERWTALRKLRPHLNRIKTLIRKYRPALRLVYGKHDRIILPVVGEKFKKAVDDQCRIIVLESGHQVLQEKYAVQIVACLND